MEEEDEGQYEKEEVVRKGMGISRVKGEERDEMEWCE